jgi:hypothetical protein
MKRKLYAGETSQAIPVFVFDSSKSDGSGLGGLTSSTSGLVAEYRRQGQSSWTSITLSNGALGTYTNSGSAGSGGGIVADGSLTGAYEFCVPDAALASAAGVNWVLVRLRGATNVVPVQVEIELDAINYQDGVRAGLSALPNANASAANGLPILDGSTHLLVYSVNQPVTAGTVSDKTGYSLTGSQSFNLTGNITGNLSGSVGSVTGPVGSVTGTVGSIAGVTFPANFSALAIAATSGQVGIDLTNIKQATSATTLTNIVVPTVTSVGSVTGSVGSVSGSVGSVTGAVGSVAGVTFPSNFGSMAIASTGQVGVDFTNIKQATSPTTLSNITIPTVSTVTSANLNLGQAVPTSNAAQTVGDALNAARAQGFGKWLLSGTTLTLYGPDGTTAVRTFTLDSATAPTQRS